MTTTDNSEKIHVALAVYDPSGNYSQHAGVTITSIFENTSSPVIIHLLHDDTLTQDNREKFIRTAQKYSQEIEFIDISDYDKKYINDRTASEFANKYTKGTLFRFFMQDVINLDKIIYLDCDIVVNLDISELWNIDIKDNCIAAALDEAMMKTKNFSNVRYFLNVRCYLIGCRLNHYINAGVMIMNLKKLRERKNFAIDSLNWLNKHLHIAEYADQDAFNALLKDSIMLIDGKFDRMIWNADSDLSDSILHGCFRRFWKVFPEMGADKLYWHLFLRSAWGENVNPDELIEILSSIPNPIKRLSILQRVIRRIKHEYNKLTNIPSLIIKDYYYRIKYKFSR